MVFTPKTPYLTTDSIVEIYNDSQSLLGIILIQRKYEPLGLALPGWFVDIGESVEDAVVRKMKGEILRDYLLKYHPTLLKIPNTDFVPYAFHL